MATIMAIVTARTFFFLRASFSVDGGEDVCFFCDGIGDTLIEGGAYGLCAKKPHGIVAVGR